MMFINDADFQKLRQKFSEPNIFLILNNASYEIRHSNFLGWLIDPRQTHGQSDFFLKKLLIELDCADLFLNRSVKVEREADHIDLLIYNDHGVLAIENKTKSQDSDGQLAKYRNIINNKFVNHRKHFVYWTLNGDEPSDRKESIYWSRYSHQNFLRVLSNAYDEIKDLRTKNLIKDYVDALHLGLLPSQDYVALAKGLLSKYKDELASIFSNTPLLPPSDMEAIKFLQRNSSFVKGNGFFSKEKPFLDAFVKACKVLGYVVVPRGKNQTTYFRFCPKILYDYYHDLGTIKEMPFYFSFRFYDNSRIIELKLGLEPESAEKARHRQLMLESLNEIHQANIGTPIQRSGKKHVGLVKLKMDFDPMSFERNNIEKHVVELFEKQISSFVNKIEKFLMALIEKNVLLA